MKSHKAIPGCHFQHKIEKPLFEILSRVFRERKMRTKFVCTNFLNTARGPGHPGRIPGTSRIPLFETQGRQSFEGGHEVFGHHRFAWKTPTPPGGLRTQTLNLCALFSCLSFVAKQVYVGNVSETPTPTTCLKSTAIHLQFVRQYAPHLYRRTFLASKLRRKGTPAIHLPFVLQYASHLYFLQKLVGEFFLIFHRNLENLVLRTARPPAEPRGPQPPKGARESARRGAGQKRGARGSARKSACPLRLF